AALLGGAYTPVGPTRILDTRSRLGVSTTTPVGPHATLSAQFGGVAGLPTSGITALVLNVTVTEGTASGSLTVAQGGVADPSVSHLNWSAGQTVANQVTV